MSFSRAFSTRRNKPELEISMPMFIGRAASQRGGKPIARAQISSPMALLATSNQQVHHAQSIVGTSPIEIRHVSSGSTSSSSDESDTSNGSVHSRETVTDASSINESPVMTEPEPNHLSAYFKPSVDTHTRTASRTSNASTQPSFDTPMIPHRAPSHSKKAHEGLHRKRSIQRMLSPPPSRDGDRDMVRSSAEMFSAHRSAFVEASKDNPFGNELAQLEEVAEEFGQVVRSAEKDADHVHMDSRGLAQFTASDYMFEIQTLIHDMFREEEAQFDFGGFF
ncbi:hypothetical protein LTR37_003486 [Vermiconidia calcicola]|uniref:Uncharacterized protein n=1 Tax=Vermiconidia calcicola TaxID=1690605 RepID=A0ACC3NPZ6_9PEZI|nr:hypothetical protein LTR37_003486 [Vermiconidia calcicola]